MSETYDIQSQQVAAEQPGPFPIAAKRYRNGDEEQATRHEIQHTVAGLTPERFIGYFSSEAALGDYLAAKVCPCQPGKSEYQTIRITDPAAYAQQQIRIGTIVVVQDRFGLWAFNSLDGRQDQDEGSAA